MLPILALMLLQILARSTVVFVAVWQPDETATEQQQKAGRGEWVRTALSDAANKDAMPKLRPAYT